MLNDNAVCRTNVPIETFLTTSSESRHGKYTRRAVGSEGIDLPRSVRGSDVGVTFIPQGHST